MCWSTDWVYIVELSIQLDGSDEEYDELDDEP